MSDSSSAGRGSVERLAAVVALASLAGAVAVVVLGALSSWLGVAITLIGLLVIVNAGWYALARRGATRTIALVTVAVGAVVLVVGLVIADMSLVNVIVTLALAAASVGSARLALHRSARAMRRAAAARTPVPPARHPVLIINPKSGGGKAERFQLAECCRERGIEPIVLAPGDDLAGLAEQAISGGADVVGMAGGDGSQAVVASVVARHDVAHVVVPAGTRNHLALDLGLDRNDVVGALDAYADAFEQCIDLATVNDRVFVNNASVGLYAKVVQSSEYRDAKRQTTLAMLPELLGPDASGMDLRFTGPDGAAHSTAHIILVGNNSYDHRPTGRGTRERLDAGVLGIVTARILNAREFGRFMALVAAGRPHRFPGVLEWTSTHFRVDSDALVEIGVDGEAMTLDPPLLFESKAQALRVRLPRSAIGRSPTAKATHVLSRTTLAELARAAAGDRS